MNQECMRLNRQIKNLQMEIVTLRHRVNENQNLHNEKRKIRNYFSQGRILHPAQALHLHHRASHGIDPDIAPDLQPEELKGH
jgi:hypothetical protein